MFNEILKYQGIVIRPPSEADSRIFQVTLGCSDNGCIFCPAYKKKKFHIRDIGEIEKDMRKVSEVYPDTRKLFFADGDAIAIEQNKLLAIFDLALKYFPKLARISTYGSAKSLENKSVQDLKQLKERKLGIMYIGFETGDPELYRFINKYGTPQLNIDTCRKVKDANIKTNVTIITGLGGKKYSKQHAVNTAKILNSAQPDQIAALTLMITEDTSLYNMLKKKEFEPLDKFEMLKELYILIENLEDFRCLFFSNHASNYFPIQARFPKDRPGILRELKNTIENKSENILTPDWMRGL